MGKTNAEMCKDYYNRKKAAKEAEKIRQGLSVQKPVRKTAAERSRAYRLRKKMRIYVALNDASKTATKYMGIQGDGERLLEDVTHIHIKEEPIIDIKEEPTIYIKQEPTDPLHEDSYLPNYECSSQIVQKLDVDQNAMNIVKVEGIPKGYDENEQFRSDCLQFANFVGMELQQLSDYSSLEVAKQCIRSILLDAQNGVYKSGVLPQIVPISVNSAGRSQ